MSTPKIWAHRGASSEFPENTILSFQQAIRQGADGIELDIHLTRDGEIVVAHDEELERVSNGTGTIAEHTLAELKELDFSKTHPECGVQRIPTLAEVYRLIRTTELTVNVELKTAPVWYPDIERKAVEQTERFGLSERVLYSSFNHYSLLKLKQYAPTAPIGLLYAIGLVDVWLYGDHIRTLTGSAPAQHPHYAMLQLPDFVKNCHDLGQQVNVWTVDGSELVRQAAAAGVDGIITNTPGAARAALKGG